MAAIKSKTNATPTTSHCQSHSFCKPREFMTTNATLTNKAREQLHLTITHQGKKLN